MFRKIWNIVSLIIVLITAALAILLAGIRLFGLQPFAVTSGSMAPAYPVGALIYVKQAQPEEVRIGDAITFYLGEGQVVATHRVIAIDTQNRCFETKGDANSSPDGIPIAFEHLIGVPVFSIPLLGYISGFVTSPPGLYIAVFIVVFTVLLTFLTGLPRKTAERDASYTRNAEKAGTRPDGKYGGHGVEQKKSVKPKRLYEIKKGGIQ